MDVDLLVIGGGINGAGIARDAAGRGISVLLVEQDDLAHHTSSASTKLIHGGLRYLEHFELGLVRAALRERERLLALAPHLVRPLEFVLPQTHSPRPKWLVALGLALYDRLGGKSSLPRSSSVRLAGSHYGVGLQPQIDHGFVYGDCWVDDSRLVVLNAVDAAERGALIHPRTRFIHATRSADGWRCSLLNTVTGAAMTVSARVLVNAAGPWVCEILARRLNVSRPKSVRLVKGSHIVVPRLHGGDHALMLQNPDRRIVFVIPYENHFSMIGTTEIPIAEAGPSPAATAEEIDYLCASVNRYFRSAIIPRDVIWSFSGTRPLFEDAAQNAAAVTRDYVLDLDARRGLAPVLSVFGGKITTYRKLAEQALAKLAPFFRDAQGAWTADEHLPGGDFGSQNVADIAASLQRCVGLPGKDTALRLARAYGTRALDILRPAAMSGNPGTHFGAGLYQTEVDHLMDREWAQTAEDVLMRRTKLFLHLPPEGAMRLRAYMARRSGGATDAAALERVSEPAESPPR